MHCRLLCVYLINIMLLIDTDCCVVLVGGPNMSVAVKRPAAKNAHDVVKKPLLDSVKRDSSQVFMVFMIFVCAIQRFVPDASHCMCAFRWYNVKVA